MPLGNDEAYITDKGTDVAAALEALATAAIKRAHNKAMNGISLADGASPTAGAVAIYGADTNELEAVAAEPLVAPGADRILFWDHSALALAYLIAGTGLTISGTTITPVAASDTASGIVELAIASEVNTGTDAVRAVTPDALAGSYAGTKEVAILVFDDSQDVVTGDGAGDVFFRVPLSWNGMDIVSVGAQVQTAGTTGTTDVQIARIRAGSPVDVLSTKLTIDSTEIDTITAAAAAVINTSNDDLATGDQIRIDVDATSTTKAKGLVVTISARLP
jgi:hypothetical protein